VPKSINEIEKIYAALGKKEITFGAI